MTIKVGSTETPLGSTVFFVVYNGVKIWVVRGFCGYMCVIGPTATLAFIVCLLFKKLSALCLYCLIQHIFIVSIYKSDLLVVGSWRICNVGSLFSVSFFRSLTHYSATILRSFLKKFEDH